jgi:acyl-CoA dehydrogenase
VPGFPGLPPPAGGAPRLAASQFSHGQSNPTYLLQAGAWRAVLRKKPPGAVLPSAHAVEREAAVLAGLAAAPRLPSTPHAAPRVPVPSLLASCADPALLGTPFYVMAFVPGVVLTDPALPGLDARARAGVYRAAAATLAAIHSVDVAATPALARLAGSRGAAASSSPTSYAARQVETWDRQFRAQLPADGGGGESRAGSAAAMARLAAWLRSHIPPGNGPVRPTLVHGDYRLDNLIFDPATLAGETPTPAVSAVLDWELASVGGHPAADLAYACLPYHLPPGVPALPTLPTPLPAGVPTEKEFVGSYFAALAGGQTILHPPPPLEWAFWVALALFRAAAILSGVGARAALGNAASARAAEVGGEAVVLALAQRALEVIDKAQRGGGGGGSGGGRRGAPGGPSATNPPPPHPGLGPSPRAAALLKKLDAFMNEHVRPVDAAVAAHAAGPGRWGVVREIEAAKTAAIAAGLWNLWLPADLAPKIRAALASLSPHPPLPPGFPDWDALLGPGLTNLEYAHAAGRMGALPWSAEAFNCSAPDTGNMEVLARFASPAQQAEWLLPLLAGTWRSCFAMTEPAVASSDATNIAATVRVEVEDGGGEGQKEGKGEPMLVIDGDKWWTSGALDPRCRLCLVMVSGGVPADAPPHARHSVVAVPMPHPGLTVGRALSVFGYDDAPHGHAAVTFRDVRVPLSHALPGLGRGFEVGQARLGPGRLHHCMRLVGMGNAGLEAAWARAARRVAFGRPLSTQGALRERLARCRVRLDGARLLVLHAAAALDAAGGDARAVRGALAAAKVAAPAAALAALDAAIQVHGGAGVSDDTPLARLWAGARTLRLADGPDEVHLETIARLEERAGGGGGGARARL